MAKKGPEQSPNGGSDNRASSPVDEMLLAAQERGDDSLETGRYLVTFKEGAVDEGMQSLGAQGMRVADARDFEGQAATLENVGDADAVVFPEIGVALLGGAPAQERGLSAHSELAAEGPIEAIEPEYFVFANGASTDYLRTGPARMHEELSHEYLQNGFGRTADPGAAEYLRGGVGRAAEATTTEFRRGFAQGFARATQALTQDVLDAQQPVMDEEEEALVLGATWGLIACRVPQSLRSGAGIRVAVLDTGMDVGHPDFVGRPIVGATFVGQPVQDLHGHGTHCIGTACGPKAPAGNTPRYGIGHRASIFVGKVLSNAGSGSTAGVLAGMNWAIANRCAVISMSLGSSAPVQAAYTAAGSSALSKGCLIIAAAGNSGGATGAPANSPTIMSVASLDANLRPSVFSCFGKIEIAAPGRDVFSSVPRPRRYGTMSGTSMATPHVAGCAALWAETSPALRGVALWRKLQATARRLPFPPSRVGAGLVQAP